MSAASWSACKCRKKKGRTSAHSFRRSDTGIGMKAAIPHTSCSCNSSFRSTAAIKAGMGLPCSLASRPGAQTRTGESGTMPKMRVKPQNTNTNNTEPADSPNIIESKSFKLYLNSFNQTRLAGPEALLELLRADLSSGFGMPVQVALTTPETFDKLQMAELDGLLLDRLDIKVDQYTPDASLLKANTEEAPVEETLVSHLLKSNCLITGQPDWASVQIRYVGAPIFLF